MAHHGWLCRRGGGRTHGRSVCVEQFFLERVHMAWRISVRDGWVGVGAKIYIYVAVVVLSILGLWFSQGLGA